MALNINSNLLSLNAQYNLGKATNSLATTMTRLSTGLKINSASDNAAGLAIAESFKADIAINKQGINNANDGLNLLTVADGALQSGTDIAQRLLDLAQQAANGTFSTSQRGNIGIEFAKLKTTLDNLSKNTSFNGIKLLDGSASSASIRIQLDDANFEGIKINAASLGALSLNAIGISNGTTVSRAVSIVGLLKKAIDKLSSNRANIGAQQSLLNNDITSMSLKINALSQSRSTIMDIDVAQETANLTLGQIRQQAGVTILAQANSQPQIALSLLSGR